MIRYRSTFAILCHFVMYSLIIIASCKARPEIEEDLSPYYLPADELGAEGTDYIYRSQSDTTLPPEIWRHIKTSEGHITSINYDHNQQVVQKQYEHIVGNGVLIDSLHLFFYDDSGRTISLPVRVLSPNRFPFAKDTSKVYLAHLEWFQPGDSLHVVLERRRKFEGDTTWTWGGKTIPAIRIKTEDKFETEKDGWTTSGWKGEEIYAKDLGLVYYRRNISEQMVLEFGLSERKPVK
ncbi:MAG TPA: hypothetical protein VMZ69_11065 [Saprospiraceae bacterium]|nr:hypothetical protein [Saprospiraceae bacterium]